MDLANIRGIIFDLDGTLYEDTEHFRYYAERPLRGFPPSGGKSTGGMYRRFGMDSMFLD